MSIVVAAPVDGSIRRSFLAAVWTPISIFPFAVATIPFRLNPATCWYWPPSGIVVEIARRAGLRERDPVEHRLLGIGEERGLVRHHHVVDERGGRCPELVLAKERARTRVVDARGTEAGPCDP